MKPVFLLLCTLALGKHLIEFYAMLLFQRFSNFFSPVGRCIQPSNVTTTTTSTTMSPNLVAESSNSTQQATEEEKENDRKLMEEWTRMFFSMGRVAQQGEQTLVFPGLFSNFLLFIMFCVSVSDKNRLTLYARLFDVQCYS